MEGGQPMKQSIALCMVMLALITSQLFAEDNLVRGFQTPPAEARPWVYWFWLDGNLTRVGIDADLEAMKKQGIGGVLIMEVDQGIPKGPAPILSEKWFELYQYMLKRAAELGIAVNMNNDGGWTGSGGPWITPELSMKMVVWSEKHVDGPGRQTIRLEQPKTNLDFYQDIAVLALPVKSSCLHMSGVKLFTGDERKPIESFVLTDGNPGTAFTVPAVVKERHTIGTLWIEFPKPVSPASVFLAFDAYGSSVSAELAYSRDGTQYKELRSFRLEWPVTLVNVPVVQARYFRLTLTAPFSWRGNPQYEGGFPLGEISFRNTPGIEDLSQKAAYISRNHLYAVSTPEVKEGIDVGSIRNVTSYFKNTDNTLVWDVPAGHWVIVRLGYTTTGKTNHPSPKEALGLECDKLNRRAVKHHFDSFIGRLLKLQPPQGKALRFLHVDSWEVGSQNWTEGFREEFRKRRGYDLLSYLVALTGRVVGNADITERFLWDFRRTIADLLLENYAAYLAELAEQHGLKFSVEAYDNGPLDNIPYAGRSHMPISEFWTNPMPSGRREVNKTMASAGHVYGHPIIGAEAFTAFPAHGKWQTYPFRLKPLADDIFSLGVNLFIFHRYAAQPWLHLAPGMTMGPWGIHFERTNTWWDLSRGWLDYLARCQYLLQQGQFIADIAYLTSEGAPNAFSLEDLTPAPPPGYDFDIIPPEVLLKAGTRIDNGSLVLPSGMRYHVLVLPQGKVMTPRLLRRIRDLVEQGLTIVGGPPSSSPSLENYPACDKEVTELARQIWGAVDGSQITDNILGRGRVVWGKPLPRVLRELGLSPDIACVDAMPGEQIKYIHRRVNNTEVYFVTNATPQERTFNCSFRVESRAPQFWWPDTGRIEKAAVYDEESTDLDARFSPYNRGKGRIRVAFRLAPYGSVFVVFPDDSKVSENRILSLRRDDVEIGNLTATSAVELLRDDGLVRVRQDGDDLVLEVGRAGKYSLKTGTGREYTVQVKELAPALPLDGKWELAFQPGRGAPEKIELNKLISWTEHPDPGVRYFSGVGTYRTIFELPADYLQPDQKLYLSLGQVFVVAEVRLNSKTVGNLWMPPFTVDITDYARQGQNVLEVSVANLWVNRLIGDEQLPPDSQWENGHLKEWPEWVWKDERSPTGRIAFATWKHWSKEDPLTPSGLIGPVRILTTKLIKIAAR